MIGQQRLYPFEQLRAGQRIEEGVGIRFASTLLDKVLLSYARASAIMHLGWLLGGWVLIGNPTLSPMQPFPRIFNSLALSWCYSGQTRIISHPHAEAVGVESICREITAFFKSLRQTADQLNPLQRWCPVLSRALVKYLDGRQLQPPALLPALE